MTDDAKELRHLEEFHVPAIRRYIAWGWVYPLETKIPVCWKIAVKHGRQDLIAAFDAFEQWLKDAQKYEAVYGKGSMLRKEHPDLVAARARRAARLAENHTAGSCGLCGHPLASSRHVQALP